MKKFFAIALVAAMLPASAFAQPAPDAPEKGIVKADGTPITHEEFNNLSAISRLCFQQAKLILAAVKEQFPSDPHLRSEAQDNAALVYITADCFRYALADYERVHPEIAGVQVKGK